MKIASLSAVGLSDLVLDLGRNICLIDALELVLVPLDLLRR